MRAWAHSIRVWRSRRCSGTRTEPAVVGLYKDKLLRHLDEHGDAFMKRLSRLLTIKQRRAHLYAPPSLACFDPTKSVRAEGEQTTRSLSPTNKSAHTDTHFFLALGDFGSVLTRLIVSLWRARPHRNSSRSSSSDGVGVKRYVNSSSSRSDCDHEGEQNMAAWDFRRHVSAARSKCLRHESCTNKK